MSKLDDSTDSKLLSHEERNEWILNLIEMIDHWNAGIERHLSCDQPDQFTIDQFTEKRNEYVNQLATLMHTFGLDVKQLPVNLLDSKQAA